MFYIEEEPNPINILNAVQYEKDVENVMLIVIVINAAVLNAFLAKNVVVKKKVSWNYQIRNIEIKKYVLYIKQRD